MPKYQVEETKLVRSVFMIEAKSEKVARKKAHHWGQLVHRKRNVDTEVSMVMQVQGPNGQENVGVMAPDEDED